MEVVMIVEDELIIQLDVKLDLEDKGYKVLTADNCKDALDIVENNNVNYILMAINIKGKNNGIVTAEKINEMKKDIPIIYTTANDDMLSSDKHHYIVKKPFTINDILDIFDEIND